MNDQLAEIAELRITALEEVMAARWPSRIAVRRRLRRDLRESAEAYAWLGGSFTAGRFRVGQRRVVRQAAQPHGAAP